MSEAPPRSFSASLRLCVSKTIPSPSCLPCLRGENETPPELDLLRSGPHAPFMPEPLRWDMTLPNGQPLRWDMGPEYTWDGDIPNSAYPSS